MVFTTVQIGRLSFREDWVVPEQIDDRGVRTLKLTGQESVPKYSMDTVASRRDDLAGLNRALVPVQFQTKTYLNGFYLVRDPSSEVEDWGNAQGVLRWEMGLVRLGTEQEVDIESRLSGATTRSNNFSATGERSHAPAVGHVAYWSGASTPTAVTRDSTEGAVVLYRGLPATVNPRWVSTVAGYGAGRVRFTDHADRERAGTEFLTVSSAWTLTNGLVRVKPLTASGVLEVSAWTGGVWRVKNWDIQAGAGPTTLTPFPYVRVVRNTYEAITLRLTKGLTLGRTVVDLTLRRGSRVVELYIQHEYAATTKVVLVTGVASTATSGYVVQTANDADGNRAIVGSAKTFVADTALGGLSKAATTTLDAFVGVVAGGGAAVSGDQAAQLYAQYLGMPGELVQGVLR